MNFYSIDYTYQTLPGEVFTHYFRAKSIREVAKATGADCADIVQLSDAAADDVIRQGIHVDNVVRGRLVGPE